MRLGNPPKSVAQYFLYLAAQDGRALTPMQVLKLVYIAHGWQLGLYGRPLINETVEAWQYGPVIRSLYNEYKKFGYRSIDVDGICKPAGFDQNEENTIEQVWKAYGHQTGVGLSALTHQPATPWSITVETAGMNSDISEDLIEDHYRRLAQSK